jgi:nucleotide-binding universal stress UspA family protein
MIRRILVPVDLSGLSASPVQLASDLARQTGAELILFYVYTPEEFEDAHRDSGLALDEYVGALWATMRDYVQAVGGPPEARFEVVQGKSIPEQILAAAHRQDVQVIVMGTHARTGLPRLILGSVAEEVLRHATSPVLVVPITAHAGIRVPAGAER